ncbi:MAG: hypothetical protein ACH37Z_02975 [Anaerolineae bacterium]|nr:hypothetical protein [Ardenticatenia bacterium]
MSGFSLVEVGAAMQHEHWLRGGLPPSFTAATAAYSFAWRRAFIQTFFVIEQALSSVQPDEAYFWATHGGAELDLLMLKDGARLGIE